MTLWWLRDETKFIFRMNYTPLSNINILQFQEDCQLGEWKNLYHSVHKRSANIISWNDYSQGWRTLLKMCFNKNSFGLLLIYFVFYIRNSLEKRIENSGVLLNYPCKICSKSLTAFAQINFLKIVTYSHPEGICTMDAVQ